MHLSSAVSNIDIVFINAYFLKLYKNNSGIIQYEAVHRKGYGMTEAEFLIALIESQLNNKYYYKGQVHSEYTKNLKYFCQVIVENTGEILQTSCECEAGKGLNAVCKHVAVYGSNGFSEFMWRTTLQGPQIFNRWL